MILASNFSFSRQMQGRTQGNAVELHEDSTNDDGSDMASFNAGVIGTLRLLDIDNLLSSASTALPRDRDAASKLCQIYLQNVDPIIKILHRPSLSKCMLEGSPYPGASQDDHSDQALECAVCYAAANTMSEAQCQEAFKSSKASVVTMYRKMCEGAIERTGLLTTRNMIVLQAFVLYLVSALHISHCRTRTPFTKRPFRSEDGQKTRAPRSGHLWLSSSGLPSPWG